MRSSPPRGVGDDPELHPRLLQGLRAIHDPCSVATGVPIDIVDSGLIGTIARTDTSVSVGLCLTSPVCWQAIGMMAAIESALLSIDGIEAVACVFDPTHYWTPDRMHPRKRALLRRLRPLPKQRAAGSEHGGAANRPRLAQPRG